MSEPRRAPGLPHIHPAAWHGAIGETVQKIAPSTEADPVAVLVSCLALFGALVGDNSWVRVGGSRHPARIWPLIVGKTGSGRKGTSFAEARESVRHWSTYADNYASKRIAYGLASGEGLISALGGAVGTAGNEGEQPVAPDGRLTVVETEFARVLTAAKRDGSTLGPILRQLWEEGQAAIMTRTAPLSVQHAHLAVIAHITPQELRIKLAEADLVGGTLNRFLLIASERPHLLAHEPPRAADLIDASDWLGKALEARMDYRQIHRDRAAEDLWTEVYAALCDEEPDGHLGAVLARGPAYTMRLALTYALADCDSAIRPRHLLAGLAVWQYSTATARRLFPDTSRDDVDRLARFIEQAGPVGRSKTEISRLFGGNRSAEQLRQLLAELERKQRVEPYQEPVGKAGGRPVIRYRSTGRHVDRMATLLSNYEINESTR